MARVSARAVSRRLGILLLLVLILHALVVTLAQAPDARAQRGRDPTGSQHTALGAIVSSGCFTDTTQADFQAGVVNTCDLTSSPGDVMLLDAPQIDQQNTTLGTSGVGITVTTWGGQTFTPAVTGRMVSVDINLFCSGCTGTTPNLTLSLRATSGGLPTGADIASATVTGFNSGSAVFYTATFASPPTITAGTQYAVVIRPTANPAPGTYALTRSGMATAGSNVYAGGTRVAGATSGTVWSIPLTGGVATDAGFKIHVDAGFPSSGDFTSSVKDANPPVGATPNWTTLSWTASTPTSSTLQFQAAASNSFTGPFNFVGPDSTSATFFTTSGASLAQFNGFQYLKYKAYLGSTDSSVTPTLGDVTVCFENTAPDTPTPTSTSTNTATATATETSTSTSTATATATETSTSTPTSTITPTGTLTPSPTGTPTHTATPTSTGTPSPTATATSTTTPGPVFTATSTPT
jgi:hypothetical protein